MPYVEAIVTAIEIGSGIYDTFFSGDDGSEILNAKLDQIIALQIKIVEKINILSLQIEDLSKQIDNLPVSLAQFNILIGTLALAKRASTVAEIAIQGKSLSLSDQSIISQLAIDLGEVITSIDVLADGFVQNTTVISIVSSLFSSLLLFHRSSRFNKNHKTYFPSNTWFKSNSKFIRGTVESVLGVNSPSSFVLEYGSQKSKVEKIFSSPTNIGILLLAYGSALSMSNAETIEIDVSGIFKDQYWDSNGGECPEPFIPASEFRVISTPMEFFKRGCGYVKIEYPIIGKLKLSKVDYGGAGSDLYRYGPVFEKRMQWHDEKKSTLPSVLEMIPKDMNAGLNVEQPKMRALVVYYELAERLLAFEHNFSSKL